MSSREYDGMTDHSPELERMDEELQSARGRIQELEANLTAQIALTDDAIEKYGEAQSEIEELRDHLNRKNEALSEIERLAKEA